MSLKRSIVFNLGGSGAVFVFGFINSILSSRVLGTAGKGVFTLYTTGIETGVLLLIIGMNQAVQYYAARDAFRDGRAMRTMVVHSLIAAVAFGLALKIILGSGNGNLILPAPFNDGRYQALMIFQFFNSFLAYLTLGLVNSYKLFEKTSTSNAIVVLCTTVMYGGLFLTHKFGWAEVNVNAFYISQAISVLIRGGMALYFYWRFVKPQLRKADKLLLSFGELNQWFRFGLLGFGTYVMIQTIFRLDYWFLEAWHGSEIVGLYAQATNIGNILYMVPNSVGLVLLSYVADKDTRDATIQKTAFMGRFGLAMLLCITVVVSFVSNWLFAALYGEAAIFSGDLFRMLLPGILPFCIANLLLGYFTGSRQLWDMFTAAIVGFVWTLVGDMLLIKHYAEVGAAITTVSAFLLMTSFLAWRFHKHTGIPYRDLLILKRSDIQTIQTMVRKLLKR